MGKQENASISNKRMLSKTNEHTTDSIISSISNLTEGRILDKAYEASNDIFVKPKIELNVR